MDASAIEFHLTTTALGRNLHVFAELDSTNVTAREMAAAGAPHGTVVIADAQRQGRGRLGRTWASPREVNLYVSVVLRGALPVERVAQISLLAGVATCETVREWCAAEIKWPNDVLAGGRKVAGVLCEMTAAGTEHVIVIGIGVNLNASLDDFPPELRDKAGSLRMASGAPIDRARFTGRLLSALELRYEQWRRDGFAPIAAAWRAMAPCLGQSIRVQEPGDSVVEGIVLDIDGDGALRIRTAGGREHRVVSGDVTVIDGYVR